jgi:hypothetical protein
VPATTNPLGVKGVGEAGTTGALAAIMNALADAVPGAAHIDMPATPEKIWAACRGHSPKPKRNTNTIDILRISVPKERLNSIPKEERVLFFLLGYAANQIIMFQKLLLFASNSPADESVEGQVHGVQIEMLLRLMIGFVWEAWYLIRKRFLEQPVGRDYQGLLDEDGKRALSGLKKQFDNSTLIHTFRNNFAFHLPKTEDMEAAFKLAYSDANFDDTWSLYFSKDKFNSLYLVSDVVLIHAIFKSIGESDDGCHWLLFLKDVIKRLTRDAEQPGDLRLWPMKCRQNLLAQKFAGMHGRQAGLRELLRHRISPQW